jgi:purine-nucleoside/S-methyl-5'-thioadenosine phosphorylase / adenosine deaminase
MTSEALDILCDPVLIESGIIHGFGRRGSKVPEITVFPSQVHGVEVVSAAPWKADDAPAADAILSSPESASVGIITADCVPILVGLVDGSRVVAIHAGWRGLAAGVIEAGLDALRASSPGLDWVAAVGPAARGCCYEIDDPVRQALSERYLRWLEPPILIPTRPGHFQLDLPLLASAILGENRAGPPRIGTTHLVCTICNPEQFESYRRDGAGAGRLRHFISSRQPVSGQG